ncbi:outer membrane protein assembly factor BamB family protein [Catelliglobosispora koreensis]|uniref:outer membrane protein assembly factor BamB family protein n=1 Tax=Catelliglobosispora koreensis TaxID=129052 RepID=UPI000366D6F6|nr:PQQ-binding-like beta-propeller repeat protein [Catelliglobosispora koreensis]
MGEIVIDLSDAEAEPGPVPHKRHRWLAATVAALVTLAGATAAQPRPEPFFDRLMWIKADQNIMVLSPGLLVLHERGRSLIAYTLDGRQAWRQDFSGLQLTGASVRDGSVVVNAIDLRSSEDRTLFLDAATGAETWRADGGVSVMDGYLVVHGRGPQPRLRVLDARTRAEVWRLPADRIVQGSRPGKIYSLGPGGLFTEHDLATGKPLRTLTLSPTGLDRIFVAVGEDYAQITRLDDDREQAELIDMKTFTLTLSAAQVWSSRTDCGPVTCAYGADGQVVLDKATGAVLWQVPPGLALVPTPAGLLATTGGDWSLVGFYTGKGQPLPGWRPVFSATEHEQPRFLVRNRAGLALADFAELTPTGLVPVGALPIKVSTCQYTAKMMACATADNETGVWRITAR